MNLNYPAGKAIDELAAKGEVTIKFPQAMARESGYDFSFSGLKSAVINQVHNAEQRGEDIDKADLAASFQAAVIKALIDRTDRALCDFPVKSFVLAGGVAANSGLRAALTDLLNKFPETNFIPVPKQYTGDNAAMIGAAGYWNYEDGVFADLDLNTRPGLDFALRKKD